MVPYYTYSSAACFLMFLRFISFDTYKWSSFTSVALQRSIMWLQQHTYLPVDGQLGYFLCFSFINSVSLTSLYLHEVSRFYSCKLNCWVLKIVMVLGWNACPQNTCLSSNPRFLWMCLICKLVLCRCNHLKMKPLRWALIQYDLCPTRREETQRDIHRQRPSDISTSQGTACWQGLPATARELGVAGNRFLSRRLQREWEPYWHLDLVSLASKTVKQ